MPEPIDFEQIAFTLFNDLPEALVSPEQLVEATPLIVAALSQVWNARGAADLAAIDIVVLTPQLSEPLRAEVQKLLDEAIRTVDR